MHTYFLNTFVTQIGLHRLHTYKYTYIFYIYVYMRVYWYIECTRILFPKWFGNGSVYIQEYVLVLRGQVLGINKTES